MSSLAVAPLVVPLVTAIATLFVRRDLRIASGLSLLGGLAYGGTVALLSRRVLVSGPIAYQLSAWPAPFGITLVADALSVFMLGLAAIVVVPALAFSGRSVTDYGQRLSYHPLFHLMLVGISGAFLTGDIFNLFVWFEVMLMASYVLVVFYSGPVHTRAALQYVVLNLVGSAVMLVAIGGLYATTGTLNMADIARRLSDPAAFDVAVGPVLGLSALLFAVFALKAGLVPFHFWVPDTYRAAPAPVAAVLAGVVKKVGVYAVIRLYFTVFGAAALPLSLPGLAGDTFLGFYGPILFVSGTASILLGGVVATSRADVDGVLAYSSISQVGFIVLPLAVGATVPAVRPLAIVAALVYALNHAVAKGALFLVSGALFTHTGTNRLDQLGGATERLPALSAAFFLGALAIVGIPPLTGFFGKLLVFDTATRGGSVPVVGVVLVGAILSIAYLSRAWNRAFWGPPADAVEAATSHRTQTAIAVGLALALVALGLGADPVIRAAEAASAAALDRAGYVDLVLGGETA